MKARRGLVQAVRGRGYHDESFGFRKPRSFELPDYTPAQLHNRATNAPLLRYADALRTHGHRAARIDPLDILQREEVAALDPRRYGLVDDARTYDVNGIIFHGGRVEGGEGKSGEGERGEGERWTLGEITRHLRSTYVGRVAYEYMHSPSKTERLWFAHLLESQPSSPSSSSPASHSHHSDATTEFSNEEQNRRKRHTHALLARSEVLDTFLQTKCPSLKRYGLEGGESMLPALDGLFCVAAHGGIQNIILAMPHRGRLNLLTDPALLAFPPVALFHKIRGGAEVPRELGVGGDVVSHLVASPTLTYPGAPNPVKVSLLPNPSHLEAVNPVALGKTRAKQYALLKSISTSPSSPQDEGCELGDAEECELGDKVMAVQLHGDASFTGQGVVMEGLGLSNLPHFTSGGSVHIVVNIGYTTPASSARSTLYCSDIGKMINAPVLHVNGDYPDDVVRAVETAYKYREHFRKDIIVDLIVYRRWGHNELDEPAFTQPLMYQQIRARRSVPQMYEDRLVADGVISPAEAASVRTAHKQHLESHLAQVSSYKPSASMLQGQWAGYTQDGQWQAMVWPASPAAIRDPDTGVPESVLKEVGRASVGVPEGFEIHPRLQRHVKHRLEGIEGGGKVDWATAEAMAFGSLLREGCDVRISGQDVGRGTFSHRHAMLVDQKTEQVYVPLNDALKAEAKLELANSSLSEMAVLGFEYGASWERPNLLPIWEAQFGDFFNGAQVIIDTFIASAETKWLKQSGITLLLPHGLDGAGPEHSSSRIERMLQLSNDPYEYDFGAAANGNDSATPTTANANGNGSKYANANANVHANANGNVNIHVTFPTTPAQYFHLLRRQMRRNYRKPLVVAAPKGLLRLPAASSSLADMNPGTRFQPVLDDPHLSLPKEEVQRVLLLTGKLFYELAKHRSSLPPSPSPSNIALIRIEELSPFPFRALADVLKQYKGAMEVWWAQEEPRNQGAWGHVRERVGAVVEEALGRRRVGVEYKGRREDAVPAPGIGEVYRRQQEEVVASVFEGL
ncbi:hypothetical protein PLICRDRAFT_92812 [Plicaturopsis crispa FD-325 SS-3]|nr:hypothetical protein PLICRDRAFT_92812 [Plicaturopsis crispa FD-325 SS-3]